MATHSGTLCPVWPARLTAMGVRAAMVPTLVPTQTEMRQEAKNRPPITRLWGSRESDRLTMASMAPMALAAPVNAPASTNIHTIISSPGRRAPSVSRANRSSHGLCRRMRTA